MTRYLVQPRDRTFVNGYRFLSFAKNMGKKIEKNIHKNVISKYSPKRLDYAKQSATYERKTAAKPEIQKTAEATGDLIGNLVKLQKIYHKIIKKPLKVKQKYQKEDIYLQKKDKKLLMNTDD